MQRPHNIGFMTKVALGLSLLLVTAFSAAVLGSDGDAVEKTAKTPPSKSAPVRKAPSKDAKKKQEPSDSRIRKILIQESIDEYPGNCPCPYKLASNGSSCGGRSAWSRAGGYSPLCYPKDVSDEMVQEYRAAHPPDGEEKSAQR